MPLSSETYTGTGIVGPYAVTFPYLDKTHVQAYLDGVLTTAFTWPTASTISFNVAVGVGVVIVFRRVTPTASRLVTYQDATVLTAADLNNSDLQNFYIAQELTDYGLVGGTDGTLDAGNKRIKNLANGVNAQDAVSMAQLALAAVSPMGTVAVANGGTGATIAAAARTNLGLGTMATEAKTITTKGDVLVGGAAGALDRLAVGAAGTVAMARTASTPGLAYAPVLGKVIYGLTYANNGTHGIDIAAGGAMDATGAYWMTGPALTKQSNVAWAVGAGGGGLDTGVVADTDYYIWEIARSDTGVVDYLFSLSSTAPTMTGTLAPYDFKRLIGWFRRAAGAVVTFTTYETEGGGLELLWKVPTLDIDLASTVTNAERLDSVKVPQNFSVEVNINVGVYDAAVNARVWVYCPDQTSAEPSYTAAPLSSFFSSTTSDDVGNMRLRTSSAGKIAARTLSGVGTLDVYRVSTMGFKWARR